MYKICLHHSESLHLYMSTTVITRQLTHEAYSQQQHANIKNFTLTSQQDWTRSLITQLSCLQHNDLITIYMWLEHYT
jgi:hypothetical protein